MTLQDCYRVLGGDYADVISRLRKDTMIEKFVFRFLEDQSFALPRYAGEKPGGGVSCGAYYQGCLSKFELYKAAAVS